MRHAHPAAGADLFSPAEPEADPECAPGHELPLPEQARQYETVARAIVWLRAHAHEQPGLQALADALHQSPAHLQRVFSRWAGVSPKRFLQILTKEHAKALLRQPLDTLAAAADAGLSGPGRLHELLLACEAVTPAQWRSGGAGLAIGLGFGPTPFGRALVAWTERGLCHLSFGDGAGEPAGWDAREQAGRQAAEPADGHAGTPVAPGSDAALLQALSETWPQAALARDDTAAGLRLQQVFAHRPEPGRLHLVLRGTNFQVRVWEALMRTRPGQVLTYGELAQRIGAPRAARAVGSALAANTLGWLIPCHRVIRDSGEIGHYRWGPPRKVAMLAWEAGRGPATRG